MLFLAVDPHACLPTPFADLFDDESHSVGLTVCFVVCGGRAAIEQTLDSPNAVVRLPAGGPSRCMGLVIVGDVTTPHQDCLDLCLGHG